MNKQEFVAQTGKIIRETRQARNITMEDLANRVDISYVSLSALERNTQDDIKAFTLYSLLKELDIDSSVIFGGNELSKEKLKIFKNISSLNKSEVAKFNEFKSLICKIIGS